MTSGNNLLFFFSALGAFNGLIAGIYFLCFTPKKNLSNYFLGALLIVLSIRIGKSVVYFFDHDIPRAILQFGLAACLFIGPFLYFFVKTEIEQVRKLPLSWGIQLAAWLAVILAGLVFPYENFPRLWTHYIVPAIYLQWGIYIGLTIIPVKPLFKKIRAKEKLKPFEKWVLTICATIFLIFTAYVWAYTNITKGSYIMGPLYFSLVIYFVIIILLHRKKANDLSSFAGQKYGDRKLNEDEASLIVARLQEVMNGKELFRNPNLKVGDLAREIKVPSHQLSRILNDSLQKNFTLFVNEYRVNAACKMLSYQTNLTIEAVGDEVGFNSKSTFFAAFKKIKGLTPNAYIRETTPDL
ncbi:AraC family transcriptional regulator [Chitinophaga tropicalis]|uniref:Helix-turn-helix domain-containing protein n=1 Tax=Chitinophaga tropicalis TaxID=2683588 RepID=A0A7K1U1D2_9BACT|nr:helix-turn-helix domain-containing protein [Chitinophaga tropicalis]MVT08177.1 helix-turn-helix domain-containing protein [Chitinophaga tropicalis]